MDYKSVFTNLCLELQQNRSWIKGLGKNPFPHSIPFTHALTAVPFVRGHRSVFPSDSEKHRRVYTSSNVCHSHEWRVDTASGKTLKKRNACLHAVRQAVEKKIACIHGLRSEGVKMNTVTETCWLIYAAATVIWSQHVGTGTSIPCPVDRDDNVPLSGIWYNNVEFLTFNIQFGVRFFGFQMDNE